MEHFIWLVLYYFCTLSHLILMATFNSRSYYYLILQKRPQGIRVLAQGHPASTQQIHDPNVGMHILNDFTQLLPFIV